jgi:hypothetical protein
MRWRTTRWKVYTTKCSSENIARPCPKNLPWPQNSLAHRNCWSTERSRAGYHARLGDDDWLRSAVGERGKWSGGRRGAHSKSQPERNAAAEPQTEARLCCGPRKIVARAHGLRSGTGAVAGETGPTRQPVERSKNVRWSRQSREIEKQCAKWNDD